MIPRFIIILFSGVLNRSSDETFYSVWASKVSRAYVQAYVVRDPLTQRYHVFTSSPGDQTANALALYLGLEAEFARDVTDALVLAITGGQRVGSQYVFPHHLTAGVSGCAFVLPVLRS